MRTDPIRLFVLHRLVIGACVTTWALLSAPPARAQSAAACPWPGPAQFLADRPSPPDSVLFTVGGAQGKVCYSRPAARGRRIFGEVVEYGKRWRTGANEPTMLFLPVPAQVAGIPVAAGRYVLMTVPGAERWTIVLSTSDAIAPMEMFNALTDVGRAEVTVEPAEAPVERFTIRALPDSAGINLLLEWQQTRVRIPVKGS